MTDRSGRGARIFALANQKGGVGKTTTAINLGTALAAVGRRTLVVDLDPQGNASTGLGLDPSLRGIGSYHALIGARPLARAIRETEVPKLSLVPSVSELSGADLELADMERRTHRLRDALYEGGVASSYDYVLIDCPPALNLLTVNAMVAADAVVVPLQCEFFALEGLSQLLNTVTRIRKTLNPALQVQGVVLTMYDKRNNLSTQVEQDVRETLGDVVYETVIPRNVRLSEAPSHGKPALLYDHTCAGSKAYIQLAGELLRREKDSVAA